MGSASYELLLRSIPLPGGQSGEETGQVPSVLKSIPVPQHPPPAPPRDPSYEGARASTSVCRWGSIAQMGASWGQGQAGPRVFGIQPRALSRSQPPHFLQLQGPAGPRVPPGQSRPGEERRAFSEHLLCAGRGAVICTSSFLYPRVSPPTGRRWPRKQVQEVERGPAPSRCPPGALGGAWAPSPPPGTAPGTACGCSPAPLSQSLSPLCSFLRFLQLFFSQSSGLQPCFSGLLRALLARYRCCSGRGGPGLPPAAWPATAPA